MNVTSNIYVGRTKSFRRSVKMMLLKKKKKSLKKPIANRTGFEMCFRCKYLPPSPRHRHGCNIYFSPFIYNISLIPSDGVFFFFRGRRGLCKTGAGGSSREKLPPPPPSIPTFAPPLPHTPTDPPDILPESNGLGGGGGGGEEVARSRIF